MEHGADVNRGDNEGWTPLHATASCGFLSIAKYVFKIKLMFSLLPADFNTWQILLMLSTNVNLVFLIFRYLIEHGANVAAVNNDGELPLDIAESDEMEELLQEHIIAKGWIHL